MNKKEFKKMLNVVYLNKVQRVEKTKKEVLEDGVIPEGYEEYITADGEAFEQAKGSYYIKMN